MKQERKGSQKNDTLSTRYLYRQQAVNSSKKSGRQCRGCDSELSHRRSEGSGYLSTNFPRHWCSRVGWINSLALPISSGTESTCGQTGNPCWQLETEPRKWFKCQGAGGKSLMISAAVCFLPLTIHLCPILAFLYLILFLQVCGLSKLSLQAIVDKLRPHCCN